MQLYGGSPKITHSPIIEDLGNNNEQKINYYQCSCDKVFCKACLFSS